VKIYFCVFNEHFFCGSWYIFFLWWWWVVLGLFILSQVHYYKPLFWLLLWKVYHFFSEVSGYTVQESDLKFELLNAIKDLDSTSCKKQMRKIKGPQEIQNAGPLRHTTSMLTNSFTLPSIFNENSVLLDYLKCRHPSFQGPIV
jgi:hypothetical protein